jgi:hypothetical protein
MLMLAEDDKTLFGKRMKGLGKRDFAHRNSGIMSYLPMLEATAMTPSGEITNSTGCPSRN